MAGRMGDVIKGVWVVCGCKQPRDDATMRR